MDQESIDEDHSVDVNITVVRVINLGPREQESSLTVTVAFGGLQLEEAPGRRQSWGLQLGETPGRRQSVGVELGEAPDRRQSGGLELGEAPGRRQSGGLQLGEAPGRRQSVGLELGEAPGRRVSVGVELGEAPDRTQSGGLQLGEAPGRRHSVGVELGEAPDRRQSGGLQLGEAPGRRHSVGVEPSVDLLYHYSFSCSLEPRGLNQLVLEPLVLTVREGLQKEEERVLGQATLELLRLLRGESSFSVLVPLHLVQSPGDMPKSTKGGGAPPSLEVEVGVARPLLADARLAASNLLRVSMETVHCVPEAWRMWAGPTSSFVIAARVPLTAQQEQVLWFAGGLLEEAPEGEAPGEEAPGQERRRLLAPGAQLIPDASEEEQEEQQETQVEQEEEQEEQGCRVTWNMERCCYLDPGASARLQECRFWPVEVMMAHQLSRHSNLGEAEPQATYHGVAYVDMRPLLEPGSTHTRGAYKLLPFSGEELLAKTKQATSVLEEWAGHSLSGTESEDYRDAGTYLLLSLALDKPLVARRATAVLPSRAEGLLRTPSADRPEQTVQDFHIECRAAAQILDQYQQQMGPGLQCLDPGARHERRTWLLGELNCSGTYRSFKDRLKTSIIRIVQKKFQMFPDQSLQTFISQLYLFLVEEMHVALNQDLPQKIQGSAAPGTRPGIPLDSSQLRLFASEALMISDLQLAVNYQLELLVRGLSDPNSWFDYGSFQMQIGDQLIAEESYQQALSLNGAHQHSLMMLGVLADVKGHLQEAQEFLEHATYVDPTSAIAWTLLGLFHASLGRDLKARSRFLEAKKHFLEAEEEPVEGAVLPLSHSDAEEQGGGGETSIYLETAHFLIDNGALQMAQTALDLQDATAGSGGVFQCLLAQARLHLLQQDYCSSTTCLKEALTLKPQHQEAWALIGHCNFLAGDFPGALRSYERCLEASGNPGAAGRRPPHAVLLRMGAACLRLGQLHKAKSSYLAACTCSPTCLTWLGLGLACYRMGELSEAEDAFMQANSLEPRNPDAWAYLALLALKRGWSLEAEQSYKFAIEFNLRDETLLQELHQLHPGLGSGQL